MELISQLTVHRTGADAVIQLLQGDITALPEDYAVDLLVVSAFPGDYTRTIIGSLHQRGVSMASLAVHKEADLTAQLGCWLSVPIQEDLQSQLHFQRILCFESGRLSTKPEELAENIFGCILKLQVKNTKTDHIQGKIVFQPENCRVKQCCENIPT